MLLEELTYWEFNISAWAGINGEKRTFFFLPPKSKKSTRRHREAGVKDRENFVYGGWPPITNHKRSLVFLCVFVLGLGGGGNSSPTGPNALPFCNRPINFPQVETEQPKRERGELFLSFPFLLAMALAISTSPPPPLLAAAAAAAHFDSVGRSVASSFLFSCCWTFVLQLE